MSQAAVERGPQPSGIRQQEYFDRLPQLFLAQQALSARDISGNLFVAESERAFIAGLESGAKVAVPLAAAAIVLSGCGPKEAQNIVTNPIDPAKAAAACEPAKSC